MLLVGVAVVALATSRPLSPAAAAEKAGRRCPADMARAGAVCIDRWEASLVDVTTGRALSPYYPPLPAAAARLHAVWQREREHLGGADAARMPLPELSRWQRRHRYTPKAVSRPGVVPNGYLSYPLAKRACEAAGKRLCTAEEWVRACRGQDDRAFPYGAAYVAGRCNVFREAHPAAVLHGDPSLGHQDPRLNLVLDAAGLPLLRRTGQTPDCVSRWAEEAVYDMVGNLDEWVDDEAGVFLGGFYSRSTKQGCEARVSSHAPTYSDYSLGTRCCRDPG